MLFVAEKQSLLLLRPRSTVIRTFASSLPYRRWAKAICMETPINRSRMPCRRLSEKYVGWLSLRLFVASIRSQKWAAQSEPLSTRNRPVQVFYGNMAITSHYVSRIRAEIGADTHRDFLQANYKWSDQQWCHIAWDSFEIVARRTQTKQAVNRSISSFTTGLISALKELSLSKTTTTNPIMPSNVPTANRMKTSATCSPVPTGVLLKHAMMLVRLSGRRSKAMWLVHTL